MVPAVPRVGLAEVLRRHGPAYLAAHPLSAAKAKVWHAILACRTAALGGHVQTCQDCGTTRHVYHSCRNRHCPLCQTRAKEAWLPDPCVVLLALDHAREALGPLARFARYRRSLARVFRLCYR